ncbi:hypothetical protein [Thalassobaculum salexigens]|uniref:hypothetical protein n=1 Tax=Thalassobaculum salexigens TaxID=455360 RepID=UPI000423CECF|nr:hypothetical protein [Thalassobaculum salexigens]
MIPIIRKRLAIAIVASSCVLAPPAKAFTVFDPANFSQNIQQVAESIKAFYQRHEQTIQLMMVVGQTALSVATLQNGNYSGVASSLANLAGVDQDYSGAISNAQDLIMRSQQLMSLAERVKTPQDAVAAAKIAMTLSQNVMNDSAALLGRLEPMAVSQQRLMLAMTASEFAVGQTQATQAQSQVDAIRTQIEAQSYEIQRLQLANSLAKEQQAMIEREVAAFRFQEENRVLAEPVKKGAVPDDWWKPKTTF